MITPSAISPDLRGLLGGADPEADRDRDLGLGLGRGDQVGQLGGQLARSPVVPDGRDDVDEAAGDGADPRRGARPGVVGATSGTRARPGGGEGLADLLAPRRAAGRGRSRRRRRPRRRGRANSAAPPWARTMFE